MVEADNLTLSDDLKFGALVLSKHPKSAEAFIHRYDSIPLSKLPPGPHSVMLLCSRSLC